MTILIRQNDWSRPKPNVSKKLRIAKRKKKSFVSPYRASGGPAATTPPTSPKGSGSRRPKSTT